MKIGFIYDIIQRTDDSLINGYFYETFLTK